MSDVFYTTIQPIQSFARNLNDLENVKGFDKIGKEDHLYAFKLNEKKKVYERAEIPSTSSDAFGHGGIENKPLIFVFENKYIPIPLKYDWEIDIKLNNSTFSRKGKVWTILNSGTIFGKLQSLEKSDTISSFNIPKQNCFNRGKEAHFRFYNEDSNTAKIIKNLPIDSTVIIEGMMIKESKEAKEILLELQIQCVKHTGSLYDFKLVLVTGAINTYGL